MKYYIHHNLIENNKSNTMSEENHNIDTTYVTGIICNACKKELPIMTMKEHLDGRGCPCRELENREELLDRQQKRFFVVNCVYEDFLNEMINGKKKKIVYRKWLYLRLKAGSQKIAHDNRSFYILSYIVCRFSKNGTR
jgi:hypothetical protein